LNSLRKFLSRSFGWLIAVIWFLCRAALVTWATLAIYYSNLPWAVMRLALAAAFAAFTIWAVWFSRQRRMSAIAIVLFLGVALSFILSSAYGQSIWNGGAGNWSDAAN